MQLNERSLSTHLNKDPLKPLYLISSDEMFLKNEAKTQLINSAKKQGFLARERFMIEPGWQDQFLLSTLNQRSLLSEKTLIELQNPSTSFEAAIIDRIRQWLKNPPSDKCLMILMPRLSPQQRNTAWYRDFDQHGAILALWPPSAAQLPRWIAEQLKQAQMTAHPDAITLLAELTEGNLLATHQAIEKLKLLTTSGMIQINDIRAVASQQAQLSVFDLTSAFLQGHAHNIMRCLTHLQQSGEALPLVLWGLIDPLRKLYSFHFKRQQGTPLDTLLVSINKLQQQDYRQAFQRLPKEKLQKLLQFSHKVDHMIKGQIEGNAWQALQMLGISGC